jgi:hypothetical protein
MKSAVAITLEIDDLEFAVKELVPQIREKCTFSRHSIGIVHCDADMDVARLGGLLNKELGIDIVGVTTSAVIERNSGYTDMGILLCVLTADDVNFSVGCAADLSVDGFWDAISGSYKQVRSKTEEDPKLILALAPYIGDLTSENYMEVLDEVSGNVPVFGGVAADHYDLKFQRTFYNGQAFERGIVFVLFMGNIKPVFSMEHYFSTKLEKKGVITKSSGNQILKVGSQTFKEYVESIVPVPDEELVIFYFQSTPFVMELPDYEKNEQPVVRALCTIDHQTGAGGFLSKMPEGSVIYITGLQRRNLSESCNGALTDIMGRMAENADYEYSMIFISTCNARELLMGDVKNLESDILKEKLAGFPDHLNAIGYYGFGEICPTGTRTDGTAINRFHNISFALCAI